MVISDTKLSDEFECHMDLADSLCGAHQSQFYDGDSGVLCATCQGLVFSQVGEDDLSPMQESEEAGDDDEEDYVDEVTTAQSEFQVEWTPEVREAQNAMRMIDAIKNRLRTSASDKERVFGDEVHKRRFEIRQLYLVMQTSHQFFSTGVVKTKRALITITTYFTFILPLNIPPSIYDEFGVSAKQIINESERMYEEYTGKQESRILYHMSAYARQFGLDPQVIKLAIASWEAAEPIYVNAKEQVRAVMWLMLTNRKVTGEKINRANLSRKTGYDTRLLKRVQDKYEPYFM